MNDVLAKIDNCADINEKYQLTVAYMQNEGISFRAASSDHTKNHYRIMDNGSSIFVYEKYFRMNLCNPDKIRLDGKFGLKFEALYKSKKDSIRDSVRPWTCSFSGAETLQKIVKRLLGKEEEATGINVARFPKGYGENGEIVCPNCDYVFKKAARCPECGQLMKYDSPEKPEPLKDIDVPGLYMELCECKTKKQLVETWNKYGLNTTTNPVDNETKDDKYLQFLDGTRIQFSADSLKLWTSDQIIEDAYFDKVRSSAAKVKDGSYRVRRVTFEKTIMNFGYILRYFVEHKHV